MVEREGRGVGTMEVVEIAVPTFIMAKEFDWEKEGEEVGTYGVGGWDTGEDAETSWKQEKNLVACFLPGLA